MFTALYLLAALPLVAALLYLLAIVRVWRSNQMLAILMFFFWPAGIYALVRYWKEDEDNIRVPMIAALSVFGVWLGFIVWGLSYQPPQAEVAEVADGEEQDRGGDALGDKVRRSVAIANLPQRGGHIDIPAAHASIDVPEHFRFIERDALLKAFEGAPDEPAKQTVGWLVHERVDLTAPNAWHVDVDHLGDGYVSDDRFAKQSRETLLAAGQQATKTMSDQQDASEPAFNLVSFPEMPRLDAQAHSATWVEEIAYEGKPAHVLDCYAVKLGRRGALIYSITDIALTRRELCLRSVRLLAGRSRFEQGHTYDDHSRLLDHKADYDLVALMTGSHTLAQP
jgi:uncharacterized membrane-anchored protein